MNYNWSYIPEFFIGFASIFLISHSSVIFRSLNLCAKHSRNVKQIYSESFVFRQCNIHSCSIPENFSSVPRPPYFREIPSGQHFFYHLFDLHSFFLEFKCEFFVRVFVLFQVRFQKNGSFIHSTDWTDFWQDMLVVTWKIHFHVFFGTEFTHFKFLQ